MSKKSGYGSLLGRVNSTYALGLPVDSNRNLIVSLPKNFEKRIYSITASYNIIDGVASVSLVGGRLIVVGRKFENDIAEIIPDIETLPTDLENANVYFDCFLGGADTGVSQIREHFIFTNGLIVPKDEDCCIILTYSLDASAAAYPATTGDVLARLNIVGITSGLEKPFKNI